VIDSINPSNFIETRITELQNVLSDLRNVCKQEIIDAFNLINDTLDAGGKILICGNGGSAADSQHFAAELVSSFSPKIKRPGISALALTTDTSIITAFSNDFDFNKVFERQVEAHGKKNDILVAITTSGKSSNCILAAKMARKLSMKTVALTSVESEISKIVDVSIQIPSTNTQHIQECHMLVYHLLSELIENSIVRGNRQ
jgi:D-sedoheptulose 7-phosphate isomerase